MNQKVTGRVLGGLLLCTGVAMVLPLVLSLILADGQWVIFVESIGITVAIGGLLFKTCETDKTVGVREGFGAVALGWAAIAAVGALPYWLGGALPAISDAYFESIAGFSTTGSSVVSNIEGLAPSILLWRSLTQWLGGMGIVLLSVAILPFLRVGGMQLYQAEVPGPIDDRLRPRIQDSAKVLWEIYFGFTVILALLLFVGGMSGFDAINHALTTMATGGFSTRNTSIGAYDSSFIHWVITVFMFIAGANFSLHVFWLNQRKFRYLRSIEFRFYFLLTAIAILITTVLIAPEYDAIDIALRDAAFQVVTLVSTTGFATVDYGGWPPAILAIFLGLMATGSMAGSTSGGIKLVRILIMFKHVASQVFVALHPRAIRVIKLDGKPIKEEVVKAVQAFLSMYVFLLLFFTFCVALTGVDLLEAFTGVLSALGNIGPGLGEVGPTGNYSGLPTVSKWILSLGMLMGRLELMTVIVLLSPAFWRK